jgi:hypothetical protein
MRAPEAALNGCPALGQHIGDGQQGSRTPDLPLPGCTDANKARQCAQPCGGLRVLSRKSQLNRQADQQQAGGAAK